MAFAGQAAGRTDADAERELEARLSTAVRQRLIADVPLGAFLSGGIDSSLVVALMQERAQAPVKTFTIRFDSPQFNEADHAAAVARHLHTDHYEERCDQRRMLEIVGRLPGVFDEPFGDSSAIPTYLVSEVARRHVTVALSGDGGDELFFGYPRYRYHAVASSILALPPAVRRLMAAGAGRIPIRRLGRIADVLRNDDPDAYARFVTWFDPRDVTRMTGVPPGYAPLYRDMLARAAGVPRQLRPGLLDLVSYLPDDILTKVDRASMAVSLEVRAPLLDHRVVELALGLPLRLKHRRNTMKWLLRRLLYKRVPRELVDRPKMGFGVPLSDWFRGPLREQMDDHCRSTSLEDLGLNPAPIRDMWRDFQDGRYCSPDLLWQAFVLMAWSRRFLTIPSPADAGSVASR
jgi:asparagine synthase (glutamine-hydrolysing)